MRERIERGIDQRVGDGAGAQRYDSVATCGGEASTAIAVHREPHVIAVMPGVGASDRGLDGDLIEADVVKTLGYKLRFPLELVVVAHML